MTKPNTEVEVEEVLEDTSAEDTPADDVPADDVPTDDVPTEDTPADDVPTDDVPAEDTPADDVPAEDVPAWMAEEDSGAPDTVPVSAIMKVKAKLKARLRDRDEEIERLMTENASLQAHQEAEPLERPKRPRISDYEDDEAYEEALDQFEEDKLEYQRARILQEQGASQKRKVQAEALEASVDSHYERAARLIETNGISPDAYRQADEAVKTVIEAVLPKGGDLAFNQFVSVIGEGSEKTMFFVGRNKKAQEEFKHVLADDPTGLKAAYHLGRLTEKMTGVKKPVSRAPKPASQVRGDEPGTAKGTALKKKYDAAHAKGDPQSAYNFKKQARSLGIDTANWR